MKEIHGKTALITGASRGIGVYIAEALAREGVTLAVAARSGGELEAVAKELTKLGTKAVAIPADITVESDRVCLLRRTKEELGPIDILVNNAGIVEWTHFYRQNEIDITRMVNTNLMAPLFLARMVLPEMIEREAGHVVNISSLSGKKGVPYEAVYSATKAGLIQWGNAVWFELEGTGVGVSTILPGYVSEVGMVTGHVTPPPKSAGAAPPERVAQAVLKAIRENMQEVIVRSGPTRIMYALNELSPRIGNWLMKRLGVVEHHRTLVHQEE